MGNPNPKQDRAGVITALVVTGFGIGWLAGLSVVFLRSGTRAIGFV